MRPRIVHVYKDYYPPVIGGVENTINLMARGTSGEFDVRVLVCSGSRSTTTEVVDGIHVTRVGEWTRFASAPLSPRFPAEMRKSAAEADLIHLHHPNPTGDIALFLSGVRKPVVMTYHSDIVRQRVSKWAFAPVQNWSMRRAAVVMPTSPQYIDSSPWLSRFRQKCEVVPLGIDLKRFEKTETVAARADGIRSQYKQPLIVFVGKLRYYKGLEYLLRAMPHVKATCLIIGSGPDNERLRAIHNELQLGERVKFLGELPHDELVAHLYAGDIFCLPSHLRSEAFGLSQVEAMACGLPVVSCNLPTGVSFVNMHESTGLTVPPADSKALAAALERLVANPILLAQYGSNAAKRVGELFSAEVMCRNLTQVYQRVLGSASTE
jgi:glycosyltransferase involved in cell wall biosynthesis